MSTRSNVGRTVDATHSRRPSATSVVRDGSGLQLEVGGHDSGAARDESVAVARAAVGRVRGREVSFKQAVVGAAVARDVRVHQGVGVVMAGGKVLVEQSVGQWIVGGLVQAKQVFAVAVIAGKVEGQVRCLFDVRGAFAFGAGAALATGLLRLIVRQR